MDFMARISTGMALAVVVGTISYIPASADSRDNVAVNSHGAIVLAAPHETPQDQVWDMTYGAERPAAVVETAAAARDEAPIVDYAFG